MELNLHANATTTPRIRAYIQRSTRPVAELATELGIPFETARSRLRLGIQKLRARVLRRNSCRRGGHIPQDMRTKCGLDDMSGGPG